MSLLERDGDGMGPGPLAPGRLNLRGRNVCPGPAPRPLGLVGASTWVLGLGGSEPQSLKLVCAGPSERRSNQDKEEN